MSEQSEFEEWFVGYQSTHPKDHPHRALPSYLEVWQACAESKDKRIAELEAEIKKLRGGDYYDITGRSR